MSPSNFERKGKIYRRIYCVNYVTYLQLVCNPDDFSQDPYSAGTYTIHDRLPVRPLYEDTTSDDH